MLEPSPAPWDYYISYSDIDALSKEAYGRGYSIQQVLEMNQGSWHGFKYEEEGQDYDGYREIPATRENNWTGSEWIQFDTAAESVAYWLSKPVSRFDRYDQPGEYCPSPDNLMQDLCDKGFMPKGHYFVDCSW